MAGVTLSSTVSGQFRALFSKDLLSYAVQDTRLDQFCRKVPIPKRAGHKSITMFRWGTPTAADVQVTTEGTVAANSTAHQLSQATITKSLAQYTHRVIVTDIMKKTELFNSLDQATKVTGQNFALWTDTVIRNVACASNLTASNGSYGSAEEGAGTHDNTDTILEYYGSPASCTQTYTGLNSETTNCVASATILLDFMTKMKRLRAPELDGGGYAYVTDPRISRDLMRDADWLVASNQSSNNGKAMYKGEVGSLYGMKVVDQTNSFVSLGSATAGDRFIYATSGGGGTGTGKDVISSFVIGSEAWGCPQLAGDSPFSPSIGVVEGRDKADPHSQLTIIAAEIYFTALRLNPNYYLVHRSKTAHTL